MKKTAFKIWCEQVDSIFQSRYCVTIEDIGFSETYLIKNWSDDDTARGFVDWIAEKYDLIALQEFSR